VLSDAAIGGLAGGGALLVAAGSWRVMALRARRRRLQRALRDPDPSQRAAALELVAERGVSRYLSVLVERALVETDPGVEATLVDVLTRAQWEPSADPRVLQLRAWAKRAVARAPVPPPRHAPSEAAVAPAVEPGSAPEPGSEPVSEAQEEAPPSEPSELARDTPRRAPDLAGLSPAGVNPVESWLVPDPWAGRPEEDLGNGVRAEQLEPVSHEREAPLAKAEQGAIKLLRDAGYGVAARNRVEESQPVSSSGEPELVTVLREMVAQRVITVTLLEEAVRRMRAENTQFEQAINRRRDDH
jgi:hypothetical protein